MATNTPSSKPPRAPKAALGAPAATVAAPKKGYAIVVGAEGSGVRASSFWHNLLREGGGKTRPFDVHFLEALDKARSPTDLHALIRRGVPVRAAVSLTSTSLLAQDEVRDAIGLGERTLQRYVQEGKQALDEEKSDRVWRYGSILAKATEIFGTRDAAEAWLGTPAMALENRRPIELLSTTVGASSVVSLLGQIEYGVYV